MGERNSFIYLKSGFAINMDYVIYAEVKKVTNESYKILFYTTLYDDGTDNKLIAKSGFYNTREMAEADLQYCSRYYNTTK